MSKCQKKLKMPENTKWSVINGTLLVIEKSKALTIEHSKVKKIDEKGSDLNSHFSFLEKGVG